MRAMVMRWVSLALVVLLSLLAAAGQALLLALIVRTVARDQPSLALLLQPWGQRWALLLACCAVAAVLMRPLPGRSRIVRDASMPFLAAGAGFILCLLAGALAGLVEHLRITTFFSGLPHPARQAAAEAMVQAAEWSALPLAAAMTWLMLRPWRAGFGRKPSDPPDPDSTLHR